MTTTPRTYPSQRVLLGPGPSEVPARVLEALAAPTLGHLDPEYLHIMDETRGLLHEALLCVLEEGLEARIARHRRNHLALRAGLEAIGLSYIPERSLAPLNAINVPSGVDDARTRARLLADFGIEIGGGLGPFKAKAWRIGLMGASSTRRNVTLVLSALGSLLREAGLSVEPGAAVTAAGAVYDAGSVSCSSRVEPVRTDHAVAKVS